MSAIDYAGVQRKFSEQKAALTRAVRSGDAEKVKAACVKAVRQWVLPPFNGALPDDWAAWQRALDDVLPRSQSVSLRDLERES